MAIVDWVLFSISIIIFGASGLTVLYQILFGLNKTRLNDKYIWGLNIQGFFTLSTFGTGILLILAVFVLFEGVAYPVALFQFASTIAFACLLSSQLLLGADLGKPFRALRIIRAGNFISPLTLDFLSLGALTLLSLAFTFGIFMNFPVVLRLWAYATILFVFLCMVVHSLLFISRVSAGYNSQPFLSPIVIGCTLWSGSAIFVILTINSLYHASFVTIQLISTAFIFIMSLGSIITSLLGGRKPPNLIFFTLSAIVLLILFCRGIIIKELILIDVGISILALIAVFLEKYETVIHFQKDPVLPAPYCRFENKPSYRPSIIEISNLICGISLISVVTYAIIIFKNYIAPFILSF